MKTKNLLLGDLLIERGLITPEQLEHALSMQASRPEPLGRTLVRLGYLSEPQLISVLSEHLQMSCVILKDIEPQLEALAKVPASLASRYNVVPLEWDGITLVVAMANPFDIQALDELRLLVRCEIEPRLAGVQDIQETIQRSYGLGASAVEQLLDETTRTEVRPVAAEDITAPAEGPSIASFVNQVLLQADKDRATDIHIEPYETFMRIRERIDGDLYEMPIPKDLLRLHQTVVSRIKVMARLDIAEKRLPQDGRIKLHLDGQELDLRISVLPTSFGEGINVRLLSSDMLCNLEPLGLAPDHLQLLSTLIDLPHGIIFVTGPTGSGKTTTLYACLSKLNRPHRKIITIEDPIEYQLPGVTQIQVHPKIGLSFAQGLRSILRHDPDIMMVGEVRDQETAEITIRSALTGHLVFSTLHTNDAAGGVTRLLDMGIEPFLVASSVLCFIAQRLVRVVCADCREMVPADVSLREQFGFSTEENVPLPSHLVYGRGCPACKGTGFRGRTAIYEFLVVDEAIRPLILRRASSQEIVRAAQRAGPPAVPGSPARAGMRPLRRDGWMKVTQGITTPQEVLRVS